jgi:hypothetical protein
MDPNDPIKMPSDPGASGGAISTQISTSPASPQSTQLRLALASTAHKAFTEACGRASRRVLEIRASGKLSIKPEQLLVEDREPVRAALEDYDSACLRNPDSSSGLDVTVKETIHKAIGVLVLPKQGDSIYCTATRVTSTLILTARHCLFDRSWTALKLEDLRFYAAAAPSSAVPIEGIIHPRAVRDARSEISYTPNEDIHDYVLLKTPIQSNFAAIKLSPPREFDMLLMFGYQSNAARLIQLRALLNRPVPPTEGNGPGRWRASLRFDNSATCSIARIKDGVCLLHACQTEGSTSGAPLFRVDGSNLELVGIHTRSFGQGEAGRCAIPALVNAGISNVGLRIGDDAVASITR